MHLRSACPQFRGRLPPGPPDPEEGAGEDGDSGPTVFAVWHRRLALEQLLADCEEANKTALARLLLKQYSSITRQLQAMGCPDPPWHSSEPPCPNPQASAWHAQHTQRTDTWPTPHGCPGPHSPPGHPSSGLQMSSESGGFAATSLGPPELRVRGACAGADRQCLLWHEGSTWPAGARGPHAPSSTYPKTPFRAGKGVPRTATGQCVPQRVRVAGVGGPRPPSGSKDAQSPFYVYCGRPRPPRATPGTQPLVGAFGARGRRPKPTQRGNKCSCKRNGRRRDILPEDEGEPLSRAGTALATPA